MSLLQHSVLLMMIEVGPPRPPASRLWRHTNRLALPVARGGVGAMGSTGAMSAEEKRGVTQLVELMKVDMTKDTAETLLLVLRECNNDVGEAAVRMLDSACPARDRAP